MTEFRLATYGGERGARAALQTGGQQTGGQQIGGHLIDIADATGHPRDADLMALVQDWDASFAILGALADVAPRHAGIEGARLLAPLPRPGTVFCAGANYADHVAEMDRANGREPSPDPHTLGLKAWFFIKNGHAVTGQDATVEIPPQSKKLDWEAELAVVIGRRARNVDEASAMACIAGYMNANDLSARDLGPRKGVAPTSPFAHDWISHKSFDGSCPTGPWLVPAQFVARPQDLRIECLVNGVSKQDSNTGGMIFNIAEQIAHLSQRLTLWPGDIILTGTPAGVGNGRGEFLQPGDRVTVRVEGLGELNTHVAQSMI